METMNPLIWLSTRKEPMIERTFAPLPLCQRIPQTRMRRYACCMPSECLVFPPGVDQWGRWWRVCWPLKGGWNLLSFACWFICYAWNCTVANSDILKLLFRCLRLKRVDVCAFIMLQDSVTYTDFINKELVQFAKYDETPALLVAALIHPDSVGRTAWSWTIKSCCTILPINIMYNNIAYNGINMVLVVY